MQTSSEPLNMHSRVYYMRTPLYYYGLLVLASRYFQNYIMPDKWATLGNPNSSLEAQSMAILATASSIGLTNPNESTFVNFVSILELAACQNAAANLNASACFMKLKKLKDMFNTQKKRGRLGHEGKVLVYPANPEDLRDTHLDVFNAAFMNAEGQANLPGPCPLDAVALDQVRLRLPARATHQSICVPVNMARSATRTMPTALMSRSGSLADILMSHLASAQAARNPDSLADVLPGFQLLGPGTQPRAPLLGLPAPVMPTGDAASHYTLTDDAQLALAGVLTRHLIL
jgi:hypothetical protein